jgi:hypothetical protein
VFGALALLILLAGAGCGKPKQSAEETPDRKKRELELPGQVSGKGWHIPWRMRDPKHPNGPPIPVLIADAKSGVLTNDEENPTVLLRDVRARLFRNGKHTADIAAPEVTADQKERLVIGRGGVTFVSLTNPPDTVVTADKITWDTRQSKVFAEGNARVTRRHKDGQTDTTIGNRITFDAGLKGNFEIE